MARDPSGVRAAGPRSCREGGYVRHNRLIARSRLLRLGALVAGAAAAAAVVVSSALGALFFLFDPTTAKPGDPVTIRPGGTPASFTLEQREKPFQRPIRVYLVPNDVASEVRSRFDRRLHFVGLLVPDRRARGLLTFPAPPLDAGTYVVAAWCPGCARYSFGRTFFVVPVPEVSRYREELGLRLQVPSASSSCPVTKGRGPEERYGNGLLSTRVASIGTLIVQKDADGRLSTKLGWRRHRGLSGELTVSGERLDAPGRMRVLGVYWGSSSTGQWGWASPVEFPSEGCWRIRGRVADVSLTYVVRVFGR